MESQPQNPEFRNNPENFHPCTPLIEWFLIFGPRCERTGLLVFRQSETQSSLLIYRD